MLKNWGSSNVQKEAELPVSRTECCAKRCDCEETCAAFVRNAPSRRWMAGWTSSAATASRTVCATMDGSPLAKRVAAISTDATALGGRNVTTQRSAVADDSEKSCERARNGSANDGG